MKARGIWAKDKTLATFQLNQALSLVRVKARAFQKIIRIHPREPVLDSGATNS